MFFAGPRRSLTLARPPAPRLRLVFERLSNQARFIQMIIAKELVISNRKRAAIVADLRALDFRPFPKVSKAKAAGETEAVVEEDEDEEESGSGSKSAAGLSDYDYLLGMAIWSLTKEKVHCFAIRSHAR